MFHPIGQKVRENICVSHSSLDFYILLNVHSLFLRCQRQTACLPPQCFYSEGAILPRGHLSSPLGSGPTEEVPPERELTGLLSADTAPASYYLWPDCPPELLELQSSSLLAWDLESAFIHSFIHSVIYLLSSHSVASTTPGAGNTESNQAYRSTLMQSAF